MMEERISDSIASSKTQQTSDKHRNDLPLIQFQIKQENPQPIPELEETIIKEIEIGESISAVHDGTIQDLGEIVPEIILNEADHNLNISAEGDAPGKWSHNDTVAFLEVLNDVLDTQEEAGGFLSRKNLFSRVTTILNDQGKNVTRAEIEKKYNNMLMTYRRCQQRLLKKGQTPFWPYFKQFGEARIKDARLHNLPSDLEPSVRRKRSLPTDDAHSAKPSIGDDDTFSIDPSTPIYPSAKRYPPNWKEKRVQQDRRKLTLVEDLLGLSSKGAEGDEDVRRALREADSLETETLAVLRNEIRATKEEVTRSVRSVKVAVQQLTQLVLSRPGAIL